jgi:hypothetical protein
VLEIRVSGVQFPPWLPHLTFLVSKSSCYIRSRPCDVPQLTHKMSDCLCHASVVLRESQDYTVHQKGSLRLRSRPRARRSLSQSNQRQKRQQGKHIKRAPPTAGAAATAGAWRAGCDDLCDGLDRLGSGRTCHRVGNRSRSIRRHRCRAIGRFATCPSVAGLPAAG